MRIALAQIDSVVGGIEQNAAKIRDRIARAQEAGAALVAFPELALCGYPLLDLVFREGLLDRQRRALDDVAQSIRGITAIVGFVDVDRTRRSREGRASLYNAAAVLQDGAIRAVHHKILLPGYDVFFERRYFTPGTEFTQVEVDGVPIGVQICEDLWDRHDPVKVTECMAKQGARIIVNVSASPFHVGKGKLRRQLIREHVARARVPIAYVNQVGAEDGYEGELVFDGESLVVDARGRLLARGKLFDEDLVIADVDPEAGAGEPIEDRAFDDDEDAMLALVRGIRDYAARSGFKQALLGLSGGIDSALVAVLAARALGPDNVRGVAMPSRFSSEHSKTDARDLAANLGIRFDMVPIDPVFEPYLRTLDPLFEGRAPDVTEENLQARIRGSILMALSNKFGSLLLSTGNKTEVALGYCTLYGDMNGGLMVLADVSKERVYSISRQVNRAAGREVIPNSSIEKVPSAELREGQVDPFDYGVVSPLTADIVEEDLSAEEAIARGHPPELSRHLARLVRLSEYKRRQAAPGIRITEKAFGVGRRMPIAYPE